MLKVSSYIIVTTVISKIASGETRIIETPIN